MTSKSLERGDGGIGALTFWDDGVIISSSGAYNDEVIIEHAATVFATVLGDECLLLVPLICQCYVNIPYYVLRHSELEEMG